MHVFLTGDIQIGKSTIIRKVIHQLGVAPGGFTSGFGENRYKMNRSLYLNPAWKEPRFDEEHTVAVFSEGRPPCPSPQAFDRLGGMYLEQSRPWAKLLLMDEVGQLERDALSFQRAVLDQLDGPIPIIGVIKDVPCDWLDSIRNHARVTVIRVTRENRNELPGQLAERFRL